MESAAHLHDADTPAMHAKRQSHKSQSEGQPHHTLPKLFCRARRATRVATRVSRVSLYELWDVLLTSPAYFNTLVAMALLVTVRDSLLEMVSIGGIALGVLHRGYCIGYEVCMLLSMPVREPRVGRLFDTSDPGPDHGPSGNCHKAIKP